jgi:hypothetical protein
LKYFLDTEFIEEPGYLELISIGIVSEDNRKFYMVNRDFNLKKVWKREWLRENVLLPIYIDKIHGDMRNNISFSRSGMKHVLNMYGEKPFYIAEEIEHFCISSSKPEFYGYYADYDWVLFCWLFGKMIDLPKGFPMFCMDIKQMMVEKGNPKKPKQKGSEHNALDDAIYHKELYDWIVSVPNNLKTKN